MSSPPATAENRDEVRSDFLDVYKTLLADKTLLASLTNENGREVQAAASGMLTTLVSHGTRLSLFTDVRE